MTGKDYFLVGCKTFGVYCLVLFVPAFLVMLRALRVTGGPDGVMPFAFILQFWPMLYAAMGFYLLIKGDSLCRLAYPHGDCDIAKIEDKFTLLLKMLGIYSVSKYFPDFLRVISEMSLVVFNPLSGNQGLSVKWMLPAVLQGAWGIFFGIYLLKDGRYFVDLAFKRGQLKKS